MKHRHNIAIGIIAFALFMLILGLLPSSFQDMSPIGFVGFCIGTALIEEGFFCCIVFRLFDNDPFASSLLNNNTAEGKLHGINIAEGKLHGINIAEGSLPGNNTVESSLHGNRHSTTNLSTNNPSMSTRNAILGTAALFALAHLSFGYGILPGLLKVVQAFLFSCCMVGLYARFRKIAIPVALHAAFDMAYFAHAYALTLASPPYPANVAPDANLLVLAGTALLFGIATIIMYRLFDDKPTG